MQKELQNFFIDLLTSCGPSGFEQNVQKVFKTFVEPLADEITTDVHGNVIAKKIGKGKLKIMIDGHADEIGLMIKHIDDNGFLRFSSIGGLDYSLLPGLRVQVFHEGNATTGIIGRKPIHLIKRDQRDKPVKPDELWIDIGAKDKEEAEKVVSVGDYATFAPGVEYMANNLISTKSTDNRVGIFVAAAVLHALKGKKIDASVFAVSSVQEEVGLRGAKTSSFKIQPDIGIAIDVTHATDYPGINKNEHGDVKLGGGPVFGIGTHVNPRVLKRLKTAAEKAKISFQPEALPNASGTDAGSIQISGPGVATAVVSIPNRYMHTPSEIISLKDLEDTVTVLAHFCEQLKDDVDLIP